MARSAGVGGDPLPATPSPSFTEALAWWWRLGWISFGGPAAQIALMHEELVERRRWIDERRFVHALNHCMLLPGPEAQQLATYIGWMLHGARGGLVAGLLFIAPSFFILALLAWALLTWGQLPLTVDLMSGIRPVAVALVFAAAWRLGTRVLRGRVIQALAMGSLAAAMAGVPLPAIVAVAALLGAMLSPREDVSSHHQPASPPASVVCDGNAVPKVAEPGASPYRSALRWLGLFLFLWASGVVGLLLVGRWQPAAGLYAELALFFTQAALLSFGGAYAVLPLVFEEAVAQQAWLTPAQMLDGLALGETTPGPLIMVVAYIGFLAGHGSTALGTGGAVASGWLGAAVATVFTFLPSFCFILAGAPLVERGATLPLWSRALAGVSAAVVGMILHLGMGLAVHTGWRPPEAGVNDRASPSIGWVEWGSLGAFNLAAIALAGAALWALVRWRWSAVRVMAIGAALGVGAGGLRAALA